MIVLVIILIIVGGIFLFVKNSDVVKVTEGKVTKGEFVVKVRARGKIEARERFELRARMNLSE